MWSYSQTVAIFCANAVTLEWSTGPIHPDPIANVIVNTLVMIAGALVVAHAMTVG